MGGGGGVVQETGKASYAFPVGYLSSGEVVFQATTQGPSVQVADFSGNVRTIDALMGAAGADAVNDRVAGQATGDGKTAMVVDATTGDEIWSKGGWRLGAFSPDGTYVIGFQVGVDPEKIAILDAGDGSVITEVDLHDDHGLGYDDVVWDDNSSLLIDAYVFAGTDAEAHPGALLRLDTGGTLTRATAVDPGTNAWLFLPRP